MSMKEELRTLMTKEMELVAKIESLKKELSKHELGKDRIDAWVKSKQDERDLFEKEAQKLKKDIEARTSAIKKREDSVTQRENEVTKRERKHSDEVAGLIATRNEVGQRIQEANSKHATLEKKTNEYIALKKDVEKKLERWSQIVTTVESLK